MFNHCEYELVDFGRGRKVERIGGRVLDRPAPTATAEWHDRKTLPRADFTFHRRDTGAQTDQDRGEWRPAADEEWQATIGPVTLNLKLTPFGHVGLFGEQISNWFWLTQQLRSKSHPRLLNLFAYTGGVTLAAAHAGAHVTHVDAAANVVRWARQNAEASGMSELPVRWIAEDATKYVAREVRREQVYDALVLDPPSFGRGPKGERWAVDADLVPLLQACARLLADDALVLLTCHSAGHSARMLSQILKQAGIVAARRPVESGPLQQTRVDGKQLAFGGCVRVPFAATA